MGSGGVGGYFGARLVKGGADVHFVARGAHLAAMREHGLAVEGGPEPLHLPKVNVTDDPRTIGPVDIVLFCVKLWDVENAGAAIRPIVGPETAVIPLQNGVDAHERLIPVLGRDAVMGGTAFVTGSIVAPGVVRQTGTYQRMTFGELDGSISTRGKRLAELCAAAGFEGVLSPDVLVPIWDKFTMLVPLANINALTRAPMGKYRSDPDLWALLEGSLRETVAAGRAEGVNLAPDAVDKAVALIRSMPEHHMTSMGNDLLRGNRLELPWFAGKIVELGRKHGVPTPVNSFVYAALKLYANGAP